MTGKIKLIALDIDGTIMDKNFRISDRVKSAIKTAIAQGIYVVVATGRMYSATIPIAKELGLVTPLITYQGGLVREFFNSDETLIHHALPYSTSMEVIDDLRKIGVQINIYLNDELFAEKETPMLKQYSEKRAINYNTVKSFEELGEFSSTKILAMDADEALIDKIRKDFDEKFGDRLNICKSTANFCEFVDKKCSKATAIEFLAKKWGFSKENIMAVGDMENDMEMLEAAGFGVAMKNGDKELQKIADYITDTVDNDGAAMAIEKFALI